MGRGALRAFVSTLLLTLIAVPTAASAPLGSSSLPEVTAYVDVGELGNANVTLVVSGRGSSSFWITLPKFQPVSLCGLKGWYELVNSSSGAYFYYNTTVRVWSPGDGSYELKLCFEFPYAVLMQDDKAWFMSPLLLAPPELSIRVYVKLPLVRNIVRESPISVGQRGGYRLYILSGSAQQEIQGRVIVEYRLERAVPSSSISSEDGVVSVEFPRPYGRFANETLSIAVQAYRELSRLTGVEAPRVVFRYYLPEQQLGGLGALGFVRGEDVNAGGKGPIMLNLALIRYAPGYHETTVIHEMVHVFLGAVGVEANANTRWFHEGMAQYLSLIIAERLGINVTEYRAELENASRALVASYGGKLGFVEDWPSGTEREAEAYVASYYIVSRISEKYGSTAYVARLFEALKSLGGAKTANDVVTAMSQAAGANLAPLFREWGFKDVSDWRPTWDDAFGETLVTALLLLGLAAYLVVRRVNSRARREVELAAPFGE